MDLSPGSCLPDICIWTQRSLHVGSHTGGSCSPPPAPSIPSHLCSWRHHPSRRHTLESPGPLSFAPTADPGTTVLALVLKTTGLPWWLGVNNPPSSAGGTGPTPLGNTHGPGASKPTGPSTEPRGPLPWQLQERLCSKKTRHSQNK